ncbi:MAG: Lrp/AsnC family transcriptional regulator [Halieaceae bacterium]|jgi:DNA-binding Lrp family transcriptional regulator|nr:Lrp/AsnC family transcriptional regulator [Halieaceae bacterium]
MTTDATESALIALLSANGRESTSELARKLNLSRSTVKDRISRLEKRGVIMGYTVRLSEEYAQRQILAHVMISSDPKQSTQIVRTLQQIRAVKSLHAVNGIYDMIAMVSAESINLLDQTLDQIGHMVGVEKTLSSIVLSTKIER